MILRLAPLVALVATAAFFGIAAYINVVEQPARLALADGPLLEQWKISFGAAFVVQGTITIVAGIAGLAAFWRSRDWRWLVGALLMLANWPWTLLMIQPVNLALLAASMGTPETRVLIEQWGVVHGVRTALSGVSLVLLIWAGVRSTIGGEPPVRGSDGS